jgi:hypothetical protein
VIRKVEASRTAFHHIGRQGVRAMARVSKNQAGASSARDIIADLKSQDGVGAGSSETAEYVAQMTSELATIAKSSADYIATMTCELSTLAKSAQLERLTILLELVQQEAQAAVFRRDCDGARA